MDVSLVPDPPRKEKEGRLLFCLLGSLSIVHETGWTFGVTDEVTR